MESGIDEDGSASIPGGIPGSRRGSKLNDFLEMKKRKPPKRAYKDKQGMYENCKSDILTGEPNCQSLTRFCMAPDGS